MWLPVVSQVFQQVHPGVLLTDGGSVAISVAIDTIFDEVVKQVVKLSKKSMTLKDLKAAVSNALADAGEVSKHATTEGQKAVDKARERARADQPLTHRAGLTFSTDDVAARFKMKAALTRSATPYPDKVEHFDTTALPDDVRAPLSLSLPRCELTPIAPCLAQALAFLTAALEYLGAELCEIAGNFARDFAPSKITVDLGRGEFIFGGDETFDPEETASEQVSLTEAHHVLKAINEDEEMQKLYPDIGKRIGADAWQYSLLSYTQPGQYASEMEEYMEERNQRSQGSEFEAFNDEFAKPADPPGAATSASKSGGKAKSKARAKADAPAAKKSKR